MGGLWPFNGRISKAHACMRCSDKSKDSDPCVHNEDCPHCNILTSGQKQQLSTPSHQKKTEKCEQKSDKST